MDIQTLSTALSQNNVQQQASVSLLKQSLDMTKTNGQNVVSMISSSSAAPLPAGSGTKVDLYA